MREDVRVVGRGLVVLVVGLLVAAVVASLVAVAGGLIGAGVVHSYNLLLGFSFNVWQAAVIGSIVALVSLLTSGTAIQAHIR